MVLALVQKFAPMLVAAFDRLFGHNRVSYRRALAFATVMALGTHLQMHTLLSVEWCGLAVTMTGIYVGGDTVEKIMKLKSAVTNAE